MKPNFILKNNIVRFTGAIRREDREKLHAHKGGVIWFTGLSASGKSTHAHELEQKLHNLNVSSYVLDGDNIRHGLCKDLGFSLEDRSENLRRISEMARQFVECGILVSAAFISPLKKDRKMIRDIIGKKNLLEIFIDCPIDVCIERDPKGMYKKAINGQIKQYTGISSPYEPPENPDLTIKTNEESIHSAVSRIINLLYSKLFI